MNRIVTFAVIASFISGCGVADNDSENKKTALTINARISATKASLTTMQSSLQKTINKKIQPLKQADLINFTPSKLEVFIEYLSLMNEAARETPPDSNNARFLEIPVQRWVDIAVDDELTDLVDVAITITEDQLGYYSGLKLIIGPTLRISASPAFADTAFTIKNIELTTGTEFNIFYADSFPITGEPVIVMNDDSLFDTLYRSEIPTIRVILDATGSMTVCGLGENREPSIPDSWIAANSTFEINHNNIIAIPYVGYDQPKVSRYHVTWEGCSEHYLRVILVKSQDGTLRCAKQRVVHSPNFRISYFEDNGGYKMDVCDWMQPHLSKNDDDSWWIGNDTAWTNPYFLAVDGEYKLDDVIFPAFKLENHTGQMVVGDTTITYTAILEE